MRENRLFWASFLWQFQCFAVSKSAHYLHLKIMPIFKKARKVKTAQKLVLKTPRAPSYDPPYIWHMDEVKRCYGGTKEGAFRVFSRPDIAVVDGLLPTHFALRIGSKTANV